LAMGNVAKHAEATLCKVGWNYDEVDQQLILTVTDDGKGFEPDQLRQTGLGMVNIGDYADAMNAKLEITSTPGNGAQLKMLIPFIAPIDTNSSVEPVEITGAKALCESGEQPSAA
jgi:signal transduction histidine kinase